jgi:hypothetical protein
MVTAIRSRINLYWGIVAGILSFEGWRGWRWPVAALARLAVALACPAVAAIVTFDARSLAIVVTAAIAGAVALAMLWDRRAWWWLLANRHAEWFDTHRLGVEMAWLNIPPSDHPVADHALRREHLYALAGAYTPGPEDAPDLRFTIHVRRPAAATRHLDRSVSDVTRETLERAGIRARVDGHDVGQTDRVVALARV